MKVLLGLFGTLVAAVIIISGPYLYWYDRTPTAQPLLHWHFWFIRLDFPDNPSARYSALLAAEKALAAHNQAVQAKQATVSTQAGQREQAAEVQIRTVTRTILKEVPVALPPAVDHAFPLPVGFLRLYNLSLGAPDLSVPAGRPDDAPSPLPISQATDVIAANNGECLIDRKRLVGLQDWVAAERAATN